MQIGIYGRGERRPRILIAEVRLRHTENEILLHEGIAPVVGRHRFADSLQVDPGRDAHARGRDRQPGIARRDDGGDGETTAGRVTGHDDLLGPHALVQQPAIHAHRIVDGCGMRILRSEPIIHREREGLGRAGDPGNHVPVLGRRPDDVPAAVDVKQRTVPHRVRRCHPFAWNTVDGHCLDDDIGGRLLIPPHDLAVSRPLLAGRLNGCQLLKHPLLNSDRLVELFAGHVRSPLRWIYCP